MSIFSSISGFQAGCVAVMLSSVFVTLVGPAESETPTENSVEPAVQDEIAAPPDKTAMEKFMARKLLAAQHALEAVAKEDFDAVRRSTSQMIELSRHEAWERMASTRFIQDTVDFVSAAEFLDRMAQARDADGVSLGFARLTLNCMNCHAHVRKASVARMGPLQLPAMQVAQSDSDVEQWP